MRRQNGYNAFLKSHLKYYYIPTVIALPTIDVFWDHPFKMLACSRGGGVKNLPNLPTDGSKKIAGGGGLGSKKS